MPERLAITDGEVDLVREVVVRGRTETPLTTREAALLGYLAARAGEAVSRDELQTRVWGYAASAVTRTVDTTVRRLRTKLERDPARPVHLLTVHGTGYRFVPVDAAGDAGLLGRADDLARVRRALAGHAVVGLVGAAGVGKSRLAGALDATIVPAEGDAVAALARFAGGEGDERSRAGALLKVRGGTWVVDWVGRAHVEAIARLAAEAPEARLVLVGRERVRVGGVAWIDVGPLAPADAATLFLRRAREAEPSFEAPDDTVAAIVDQLDRLPLAIELAAARAHVLGPDALLRHSSQPAGAIDRALADAWDALPTAHRDALAACAVFRGTFPLAAAEAVLGPGAVDALQALRDRSLVGPVREGGEVAFRLANAVRSFAATRRSDDGPAERHRAWHLDRARALEEALDGPGAPDALRRLRGLRADLAALDDPLALDALLEVDGPVADRLAGLARAPATADVLRRRADALRVAGRAGEARDAALAAVAASDDGLVRARAQVALAFADLDRADPAAEAALCAVPTGPIAVLAWLVLGVAARRRGDRAAAERAFGRALERVRADGVVRYEAAASSNLANLRREAGHLDEAERLTLRACDAFRALGLARNEAQALHNLGGLRAERGDLTGAIDAVRAALVAARATGDLATVAHAAHALGHLLHRLGALEDAEGSYVEAVGLLRTIDPRLAASAQGDLGALYADRGLLAAAERALDEATRGLGADAGRDAVLLVHRAHLLAAHGRFDEATALVDRACSIDAARCRMAVQLVRLRLEETE